MKNIFKENWIKRNKTGADFTSDIKDEVEGAEHYRHLASEFTEMAEDEEGHKKKLEEIEAKKTQVEKPGPSIHSEKWDKCVADVKAKGTGDPYAICTSQLGEESFKSNMTKSELSLAKEELTKAIDITQAGSIPNSLLARQDLKGDKETTTKSEQKQGKSYYVEITNTNGGKASYGPYTKDIAEMTRNILQERYDPQERKKMLFNVISKSSEVDETGKQLDEEIKQADNSSDFVENIKAIQLKRQKAIIEERSNETFKSNWKEKYGQKH